jgi:hypothetical protein
MDTLEAQEQSRQHPDRDSRNPFCLAVGVAKGDTRVFNTK